jgi:hypothetical protein
VLTVAPITLRAANAYVDLHHRHHGPSRGHKFSVSVVDATGAVRGVAIVGRPVARNLDDGLTAEVTRLCTDGATNACSMLYSAAWRAAKGMGYRRIVTYILDSEGGSSLKAAGWIVASSSCGGGSWSRSDRERMDKHPTGTKQRWEVSC